MPREVVCKNCGHRGDLYESVYFADDPPTFKFKLQCPICLSDNCIVEEVKKDEG
jgi:hypothetical protein